VHIVTGPRDSAKSAFIARLCTQRPDWLGLVDTLPGNPASNLRPLGGACPCCIGKVVLQVTLARALRQTGALRAFVELADSAHAAGLEAVLAELPLALSVRASRPIVLPRDHDLEAGQLTD
jgi:hypothetical protein